MLFKFHMGQQKAAVWLRLAWSEYQYVDFRPDWSECAKKVPILVKVSTSDILANLK